MSPSDAYAEVLKLRTELEKKQVELRKAMQTASAVAAEVTKLANSLAAAIGRQDQVLRALLEFETDNSADWWKE